MSELKKITFFGDIMVEPPLLAQAKVEGAADESCEYDFDFAFERLSSICKDADYLVGNLETPIAGKELGYTNELVAFNTPETLLVTLKNLGFDAFTMANNHDLDRGYEGMCNTIDAVNKYGFAQTGIYKNPDEKDRILYATIGDTRIAIISYTYRNNKKLLTDEQKRCVNMLITSEGPNFVPPLPEYVKSIVAYYEKNTGEKLRWEDKVRLRKSLGVKIPYADDRFDPKCSEEYLGYLQEDYEEARRNADVVIFCPHTGGQFNTEPGKFSSYIIDKAKDMGFDAILAAHSHTTQKAELFDNNSQLVPVFYSLGNVSMSPNTVYSVKETLPDYGIAVHLYVAGGKIEKTTFSMFKMYEPEGEKLKVIPINDLYNEIPDKKENCYDRYFTKEQLIEEAGAVYQRITGRPAAEFKVQEEYEL